MQITGVSEVSPISPLSAGAGSTSAHGNNPSPATATTTVSAVPAVSVAAPASSTAVSTPAATASFSSTTSSSSTSSSTSPSLISILDSEVTYSTTVGGKSYFGNVAPFDGQYEATVNELPGANATGASIDLAETNLNSLINFLV